MTGRVALLVLVLMWPHIALTEERPALDAENKNKIELFVGATHLDVAGASEDEFSLGITYERRVNERFGLGALVEFTDGAEAWAWAAPLFIHATDRIRVLLAPGLESEGGRDEFLVRVGVGYEYEMGRLSLAPEFNVDIVGGQVNEVYGISVGLSF